jgi:iron-sulfur cluster assembly protein
MLTITESAAEVIKMLLANNDQPESSGLRIAASTEGEAIGLQASIADEPTGEDEVIETGGVRVFLESEAAEVLDDKVLVAQQNDNGEVELAVRD